ncbi:MAG: hypothetical protein ACSHXZ_14980 [Gammaproteobacteria bacterium]
MTVVGKQYSLGVGAPLLKAKSLGGLMAYLMHDYGKGLTTKTVVD